MDGIKRNWRSRKGREVHTEHTREVVRTEMPDEVRTLVLELAERVAAQNLEIVDLKKRCATLSAALHEYVISRAA